MRAILRNLQTGADRGSVLLLALLGAAFVLRVWGIWFGLPHVFHNDEGFEIVRALQLGAGEYDFGRIGKGGYFYLLFVEYSVLFAVLFLSGAVASAAEFGEYYIRDPSAFYLIGRATTAVIGTLTVYLVYRLGRLAWSPAAGLFAATLLAFNVLHAYLSHLTTVDVPMTFLSVAALYFAVRMVTGGSARDYWWAALMAALATSTKIPAVLVLVPLLVAHCYFVKQRNGAFRQYVLSPQLWQAAAIFVVTYVLTTPGILIYFDDVVANALGKFGGLEALDPDSGEEGLDERSRYANTNLFVYYYQVTVDSMTLPVFAVSSLGLLYALWKRSPVDVMLVSFTLVVYVVMAVSSDTHHFFPRYILPILPVLALLGGRLLAEIPGFFTGDRRASAGAAVVLAALVALPVAEIVASNHQILKKDTRAIAREWFDANIPAGSKVFIEGSRTVVSNATIPLQNSPENLKESIEYYRDRAPGRAKYFRLALNSLSGETYDLLGVQPDEIRDLQYYKDLGVQYFVLRPASYEGSRLKYTWPELVQAIRADPDIELLRRFEPTEEHSWRSPLIEIYRVNSNVEQGEQVDQLRVMKEPHALAEAAEN